MHFEDVPSHTEIPACVAYGSTPLHDAVRKRDLTEVVEMISSGFDPTTKDSLGQTALELAINCDDLAIVLTLHEAKEVCEMLRGNWLMLKKLAMYLAAKSYEEKDGSGRATQVLMQMQKRSDLSREQLSVVWDAARAFANPSLVESTKMMTFAELEEHLACSAIKALMDHQGNNFYDYCVIAKRKDLSRYVSENCYNSVSKRVLLKCGPLQLAAEKGDLKKLLEEVEVMIERGEPLPERLDIYEHNDSLLKRGAVGIINANMAKNGDKLSQSITLCVRLVKLGFDPFAITCGDARNFVEFVADQLPKDVFIGVVEKFPEEITRRAIIIFEQRARDKAERAEKEAKEAASKVDVASAGFVGTPSASVQNAVPTRVVPFESELLTSQ